MVEIQVLHVDTILVYTALFGLFFFFTVMKGIKVYKNAAADAMLKSREAHKLEPSKTNHQYNFKTLIKKEKGVGEIPNHLIGSIWFHSLHSISISAAMPQSVFLF